MLNAVRKLNFGWIAMLIGVLLILSGISLTEGKGGDRTLLCFDAGCIYVQGITNVSLGMLIIGFGIFLVFNGRVRK